MNEEKKEEGNLRVSSRESVVVQKNSQSHVEIIYEESKDVNHISLTNFKIKAMYQIKRISQSEVLRKVSHFYCHIQFVSLESLILLVPHPRHYGPQLLSHILHLSDSKSVKLQKLHDLGQYYHSYFPQSFSPRHKSRI